MRLHTHTLLELERPSRNRDPFIGWQASFLMFPTSPGSNRCATVPSARPKMVPCASSRPVGTCQVHIPWRDRSWQMVMPQYIGCCQRAHDESWWIMKIYDDIWWYMLIYDDIWWCMLIYEPQQHEVFWVISQHINHWGWTCPCLNMDARTNTHQGFAEPSPVDAQSGTVVIGSALLDGPGGGEANKTLQGRREQCTRSWYIKMGSG